MKYTDPDGRSGELAQIVQEYQGCWSLLVLAVAVSFVINPDLRQETAECIENACTTVSTTVKNTVDCVRTNVAQYKAAKEKAKELTKAVTDRKSNGSYTITFASGKTYSGKGSIKRAIESAAFRSEQNTTMPVAIDWTPADTNDDAFEAEYIRIQDHGGPASRYEDAPKYNYNKIQSHGEIIYLERHGCTYDRTIPLVMELQK